MLKAITLQNFKVYLEETRLPLAQVSILLGPNSAGKSTWMQAIQALAQTWEGGSFWDMIWDGPRARLGGFRNVVHDHDLEQKVVIGIELEDGRGVQVQIGAAGILQYSVLPHSVLPLGSGTSAAPRVLLHRATLDDSLPQGGVYFEIDASSVAACYSTAPDQVPQIQSDLDWWVEHRERVRVLARLSDTHAGILVSVVPQGYVSSSRPVGTTPSRDADEDSASYLERVEAWRTGLAAELAEWERQDRTLRAIWDEEDAEFRARVPVWRARAVDAAAGTGTVPLEEMPATTLAEVLIRPVSTTLAMVRAQVQAVRFIGGLRLPGERWVDLPSAAPSSVGSDGTDLAPMLALVNARCARVNDALAAIQGAGESYEIVPRHAPAGSPPAAYLELQRGSSAVGLRDVGSGIRQVLPVLAEYETLIRADGAPGGRATLFVEQPELHLHPRLQGNLASWLAGCERIAPVGTMGSSWRRRDQSRRPIQALGTEFASEETAVPAICPPQVVIETHSEVIVRRMARMVKAGLLPVEALSVVAVLNGGVQAIPISERGRIDWRVNGLSFFREVFSEMED